MSPKSLVAFRILRVPGLLVGLAACAQVGADKAPPNSRAVALTFDDLPAASVAGGGLALQQQVTAGILAALREHNAPAIGFVNEDKLLEDGVADPRRIALLRQWVAAGQALGNHGFSHRDLHHSSVYAFMDDVTSGDRFTRTVLAEANTRPRWFRHPYLHTGKSLPARDSVRQLLATQGYNTAPVTIDNNDYIFAYAYDRVMAAHDTAAGMAIVSSYIAHMDSTFGFFEAQSQELLGRAIPQVLLLHANALNAQALSPLLTMMERRGYRFITLDEAVRDSIYQSRDEYIADRGIPWIHRWAPSAWDASTALSGLPRIPWWIDDAARGEFGDRPPRPTSPRRKPVAGFF
jgi:peptidoglycan/xylan/chitin deacetylase (PgdA/CDA1 family)